MDAAIRPAQAPCQRSGSIVPAPVDTERAWHEAGHFVVGRRQGGHRMPRVSAACALLLLATGVATSGAFTNFESGHVRPLAITPDGSLAARGRHARRPPRRVRAHPVRRDARSGRPRRPRAGRRRGPHQRRWPSGGVGREPPLRQRQHRRDRSRRAGPLAGHAHAARRRRAARRRVRRHERPRAPSSPRRTAARTGPAIRSSPPRASAAPTSGPSTPTIRARRWAAPRWRSSSSSATRRARWP